VNQKIKKYSTSDYDQCVNIFKSNIPEYFAKDELSDFQDYIKNISKTKDGWTDSFYILKRDKKLVGCAGLGLNKSKKIATLSWGMVDKNYHRNGIGTQLTNYRLNLLQSYKLDLKIRLDTSQHSYLFYEKFGFKIEDIEKDGYEKGMHKYYMVY
jgi:ribosomal-protein-alanine N-acetyltransferase